MSTLTDKTAETPDLARASEWRLRRSRGWQIPAAVSGVSLVLFTACLVYVFSRSIAFATFAAAVAALALLLLSFVAALFAYSCYSARYRLEPDLLAIEWLWMTEVVPLAAIDGLYSGRQLGQQVRVKGLVWPGHYLGRADVEGLGTLKLTGTSVDPDDLLIITTPFASYGLSPEDPEGFRAELVERLDALDPEEAAPALEPATQLPRLLRLSILRDRVALGLLASATLVLVAAYGYLSARIPGLPELITLQLDPTGAPLVVGPPADAFGMPMVGTAVLVANAIIAAALHGRQVESGRLMAGGALFFQLLVLVAVLIVV